MILFYGYISYQSTYIRIFCDEVSNSSRKERPFCRIWGVVVILHIFLKKIMSEKVSLQFDLTQ